MSRIPERRPDTLNDEQRAVYEEIASGPHGHVVGPFHAWLETPDMARRIRALSEYIRFRSSLPRPLAELAILVTGRFWKAEFEFYAHAKLGREAGLDEGLIAAIAEERKPDFAQSDQEIVYTVCTEMYQTHRVSDATFARAEAALGRQALVELIATIGYYSMVSMTLNAFEAPLPEGEPSPFPD